ncbi:unnamed protein product [Adineta steineri]|uniref:G-protein coupled receptors family 1 profile domain-containing protein n=1 Tax=Adineta steineri TaxID=433720 RepID=A0A819CG24_9BILA|nr:unnamed protein product [Adineta steineri]CAF3814434.1 unnamed protein product [Adineta steineri]
MSSTAVAQNIINIAREYTISVYFIILICGLTGNICNIIVFSGLKIFRHNQWTFYLTVASITDLIFVILVLPFRIADYGYGYDLTKLSLAWCKIRQALVSSLSLMSLSSICFAAIDQYLSTHYSPWLRQLSTLKLAHRLVYSTIVILALLSIPFLIFFEIQSSAGCTVYNSGFSIYYSFVHFCILSGVLPITVSGLSAIFAYVNVRRIVRQQVAIVRRRLDRQLTAMVLTKVIFLVITISPFITFRIYLLNRSIDPNDSIRLAIEQLLSTIFSSLFYVNFSGTFYLFLSISKRFRQQVKHALIKKIGRKLCRTIICKKLFPNQNQIAPTNTATDMELT